MELYVSAYLLVCKLQAKLDNRPARISTKRDSRPNEQLRKRGSVFKKGSTAVVVLELVLVGSVAAADHLPMDRQNKAAVVPRGGCFGESEAAAPDAKGSCRAVR